METQHNVLSYQIKNQNSLLPYVNTFSNAHHKHHDYIKKIVAIHTTSGASLPAKIWNILKAQWKRSCFTFRFSGNGLAPTTNKYCDFSATLTCSVIDENIICNVQN